MRGLLPRKSGETRWVVKVVLRKGGASAVLPARLDSSGVLADGGDWLVSGSEGRGRLRGGILTGRLVMGLGRVCFALVSLRVIRRVEFG